MAVRPYITPGRGLLFQKARSRYSCVAPRARAFNEGVHRSRTILRRAGAQNITIFQLDSRFATMYAPLCRTFERSTPPFIAYPFFFLASRSHLYIYIYTIGSPLFLFFLF